jgi:16S rRNA (cytosine967-C5)-methyltransferase
LSRYHSYLNSAKEILKSYNGEEPFSFAIKKFFAANKKMGSKDRKQVSQLCYSYFRLGKVASSMKIEERILLGYFLCTTGDDQLIQDLKPDWYSQLNASAEEKLIFLSSPFQLTDIFPWNKEVSEEFDYSAFCTSHFIQPDLFLRIRPDKGKEVYTKLNNAGLKYQQLTSSCIALPNTSKIDTVIEINKEAVIQDYSSQLVGDYYPAYASVVWDCCAASGGKSLMLYDKNPSIDLTVSDIRESILANLKKRFKEAGIRRYKSFVADLGVPAKKSPVTFENGSFDLIIADVPCTGSGTWGRTPEQLFYFDVKKIEEYAAKQKRIVGNVIHTLKPGGYLLYITCSVFKKENEEAVKFIESDRLELVKKELLKGYDKKADTLFVALFRKPL